MNNQIEFTELLACGHHRSLAVHSVESDYLFCRLCETQDRLRDALEMEKHLSKLVEFLKMRTNQLGDVIVDAEFCLRNEVFNAPDKASSKLRLAIDALGIK